MEKIMEQIKQMVAEELKRANQKFPPFNSDHEAISVIREEVEEAADEMRRVSLNHDAAWGCVKNNLNPMDQVTHLKRTAEALAAEAIQVAAMCEKYAMRYQTKTVPVFREIASDGFGVILQNTGSREVTASDPRQIIIERKDGTEHDCKNCKRNR